jgi:hypothetical protein
MALFTPSASPAVTVKEIDLTGVVPNVQTSTGAFVGNFGWGAAGEAQLISTETELVNTFSAPTTSNTVDFHSAAYFLRYSNSLQVVREVDSDAKNAVANHDILGSLTAQQIKNLDAFESLTVDSSDGAFLAKYPGSLGNSLQVSICGSDSDNGGATNFDAWAYKSSFDAAPGTSTFANRSSKLPSFISSIPGSPVICSVSVNRSSSFITRYAELYLKAGLFLKFSKRMCITVTNPVFFTTGKHGELKSTCSSNNSRAWMPLKSNQVPLYPEISLRTLNAFAIA